MEKIRKRKGKAAERLPERNRRLTKFRCSIFYFRNSQDITAEVLVLDDIGQLLVHVGGVDLYGFLAHIGSFEGKLVEDLFENGMQAASSDILGLLVHAGGEASEGFHGRSEERRVGKECRSRWSSSH